MEVKGQEKDSGMQGLTGTWVTFGHLWRTVDRFTSRLVGLFSNELHM